jgi:hypothetical protein
MRPIDHFFPRIDALEISLSSPEIDPRVEQRLSGEFCRLTAPVIGASAASNLCYRILERIRRTAVPTPGSRPAVLEKLGSIAAFFLGEYNDFTMPLDKTDWEDIQETLKDVSEEIDINTLTKLMGELLSRGFL